MEVKIFPEKRHERICISLPRGQAGRSPEQAQQVMQKWMAWFKELAEEGHVKDRGQPLERTGKLVLGKRKTVSDGPFAEAKDVVGGYSLIVAKNLAGAGGNRPRT